MTVNQSEGFLKTLGAVVLFYRIQLWLIAGRLRDELLLSCALIAVSCTCYVLFVVMLVPKFDSFLLAPIQQSKQLLGFAGPLRIATLLHVAYFCLLAVPFAQQTFRTIFDSAPLILMQQYFRRPVLLATILACEALKSILLCELILSPWLWGPFLGELSASGLISLILLHGLAWLVLILVCLTYVAARFLIFQYEWATFILWGSAIAYYGSIAFIAYQTPMDPASITVNRTVRWIVICLISATNGKNDLALFNVGIVAVAAVTYGAIPLLSRIISGIGGELSDVQWVRRRPEAMNKTCVGGTSVRNEWRRNTPCLEVMKHKALTAAKSVIAWYEIRRLLVNPTGVISHIFVIGSVLRLRSRMPEDMGLYWTVELSMYGAVIFFNSIRESERAAREPEYFELQIERGTGRNIGNTRLILQTVWVSFGCSVGMAYSWWVGKCPVWIVLAIWLAMVGAAVGMTAVINGLCFIRAMNSESRSAGFDTLISMCVIGTSLLLTLVAVGAFNFCETLAGAVLVGTTVFMIFGLSSILLYQRILRRCPRRTAIVSNCAEG